MSRTLNDERKRSAFELARTWIFSLDSEIASMSDRALLLALVESMPNIEPSRAKLARMLGTTERTITRLLRSVEEKGLVAVEHARGKRSHYSFLAPPGALIPDKIAPPDEPSPLTNCPDTPDELTGVPLTNCPPKQTRKAENEAGERAPASLQSPEQKSSRSKPRRPIPADWQPAERHLSKATERGIDGALAAEKFRAHAETNDRRCVDWDRAFDMWLLNERAPATRARGPIPQSAHGATGVEGARVFE